MSVKAISWAFDQALEPSRKIVLLALADFADDAGACWPSMERIAAKSSMSRRTVVRAISELEEAGLVSREQSRDTETNRQRPNFYRLSLQAVRQVDARGPCANLPDPCATSGASRAPLLAQKPSIDPSIDPSVPAIAKKSKGKKPKQHALPGIETLPPWADAEQWERFRRYRTEIGSPMTEDGERLLLGDLRRIAEGDRELQKAVIEQTIRTGRWLGLFPLKTEQQQPQRAPEKPRAVTYFE